MRRVLFVMSLSAGLALSSGCFNRSTEPVQKKDTSGNLDRLKSMKGGANPNSKGKGPAPKTDTPVKDAPKD